MRLKALVTRTPPPVFGIPAGCDGSRWGPRGPLRGPYLYPAPLRAFSALRGGRLRIGPLQSLPTPLSLHGHCWNNMCAFERGGGGGGVCATARPAPPPTPYYKLERERLCFSATSKESPSLISRNRWRLHFITVGAGVATFQPHNCADKSVPSLCQWAPT